jgi:hypothetical protein
MRSVGVAVIAVVVCLGLLAACAKHSGTGIKLSKSEAPAMQRELMGDAGWNQPYQAPTSGEAAPAAPSLDELKKETAQAMAEGMAAPPSAPPAPGQPGVGPQLTPGAVSSQQFNLDRWFSPAAYAADTKPAEQYLIRNGEMMLNIESYDKAAKAVEDVAAKYGGVVTDSNMQKSYDGTRSGYVTLRIPCKDFFNAWGELTKIGEVLNQNTTSQDVSQEYVAAVSRMKNLTAEQTTLQGMLADAREVQRTRGLGEAYKVLLDTQARLSDVTGELQSTEDQIAQLADQITRSTIKVNMGEKAVYQADEFTWGFGDTLKAAGKAVVLGVKGFINWLIFFIVTTAWWLALIVVAVRALWLRWRKKRLAAKAAK